MSSDPFDLAQRTALTHRGTESNSYRHFATRPLPDIAGYESILKLWDNKRGGRAMPCRADFSVEDFAGWYGAISISVLEGDDLRFTLYGTRYVDLLGVDLTNKLLCASMAMDLIDQTKRYFATLVQGPFIGHMTGLAPTEHRDFLPFDVLDLPLSDDGRAVTTFLHALSTIPCSPSPLTE